MRILIAQAHLTVPTPALIVSTIKLKKARRGRFGTEAVVSVQPIVGGNGSVTSFHATIGKHLVGKAKKLGVVDIKCPDGKILAHGDAVFADGTEAEAEAVRPCIPMS